MTEQQLSLTTPATPRNARRAALSSFIGSMIEWYDFALFGTMSALVFGELFFSDLSPGAGTIASLTTFAVGYVARPLGALAFGYIGDRVGRKTMLVWSLMLMGGSTVLIAALPTYEVIGVWAPMLLLLLRLMQGFSVGGEWGGATTLTAEHAPQHRRGLLTGIAQLGGPTGPMVATGVVALSSALTGDQFLEWGWRIPFAFSLLMLLVGVYIRKNIDESPVFDSKVKSVETRRQMLPELVRTAPRGLVLAIFVTIGPSFGGVIATVYVITYAKGVGFSNGQALASTMIATSFNIVVSLLAGRLSDRYGRRSVFVTGAALMAVSSFILFAFIDTGSMAQFVIANVVFFGIAQAIMWGTIASIIPGLFPAHIRSTGTSLGYQLGALAAGFGPAAAASIVVGTGSTIVVSLVIAGFCTLSIVAVWAGYGRNDDMLTSDSAAHQKNTPVGGNLVS